jgi:DNA helicase HerA-like ATPase
VLSALAVAKSKTDLGLLPSMANRHGLIAGATGTGKTVTLQRLAERFSSIGVPVFLADVKGDLAGLAAAGGDNPKVAERVKSLKLDGFEYRASPVMFWDVFGVSGHPVRATISEMGPLLLGRILDLNETQSGVLTAIFKVADDSGMLLLDLKDLRAMLQYAGDNASQLRTRYGNISTASIGAIQRGLLTLESQGGEKFFGEPAVDLGDLMQTVDGKGVVSILAAEKLLANPRIYSTLLLWILSELFENLPEVGDPEKPKLVFFFDEAHLLFNDAPKELLERIELRAFKPRDQQAMKAVATTFRTNPKVNVEKAITELQVGEALVSFLDARGAPLPVERAFVIPPASRLGTLSADERRKVMEQSLVAGHYEKAVDRESAYEQLKARAQARAAESAPVGGKLGGILDTLGIPGSGSGTKGRTRETAIEAAAKSAARAIGSEVGRRIIRGVLGSIPGGRR